jgi:membrane protease subunit HflC
MKRTPITLVIGALLLIVAALLLFTFQVRKSEVAVVTTFGRPTRPITEPGAYFKAPWPIQNVYKFDQRVQNFENDKLTEGLTRDSFNLLTSVYLGWKITDPQAFFPKFAASPKPIAEAEKNLETLLGAAERAVVGKHPLSDFISTSNEGTNFLAIEKEILSALQTKVRENNYGLDIEFLGFKKLQLPESATQTVFDRMTSERKVLADKSQYEGEAEAQKIRSEAERKAAEMLATAEGTATQIRGRGEGEAAKSLAVFQQEPELANFIFKLYALESSTKERTTLILGPQTSPYDLLAGLSTNLLKTGKNPSDENHLTESDPKKGKGK